MSHAEFSSGRLIKLYQLAICPINPAFPQYSFAMYLFLSHVSFDLIDRWAHFWRPSLWDLSFGRSLRLQGSLPFSVETWLYDFLLLPFPFPFLTDSMIPWDYLMHCMPLGLLIFRIVSLTLDPCSASGVWNPSSCADQQRAVPSALKKAECRQP